MLTALLTLLLSQAPAAAPAAAAPPAAELSPATHELFDRLRPRVAQVRIIEGGSGSKSSIGTAFFVSPEGHALTNYHVVADVVRRPAGYAAQLVRDGGEPEPVAVLAVDVVHDLAVVKVARRAEEHFTLRAAPPPHGARLYAMGNPHDLGTTIVEGTYNGLVTDALYARIHFTGAINPGMSGGPCVSSDGQVVGVNVATAGNELGFLVPAGQAAALLERARALAAPPTAEALRASVGAQLHENQERVAARLLGGAPPAQALGEARAAGRWAPFLKCWGDTPRDGERPYTVTRYSCAAEEDIFLSGQHRTGAVRYQHRWARAQRLGAVRFAALQQSLYEENDDGPEAGEGDVTAFSCTQDFVRGAAEGGARLRAALCLRAYKDFPGLYDVTVHAATLEAGDRGLVSTFSASGFSAANARALARRFLESITWSR